MKGAVVLAKKFAGYLLASDYDGTIQPYGKPIPERNLAAIRYFMEEGGLFTVATGRAQPSMQRRLPDILHNAPVILCNGAQVYDYESGREIWASHMPPIAEQLAREILEAFPEVGLEIYKGRELYLIRGNALTDWQLEREGLTAISCTIDEVPQGYQKFMMIAPHEQLLGVQAFCEERLSYGLDYVFTEPQYYEVLAGKISKAEGLRQLHEYLGIPRERVIAVGDYFNDREMIAYAGFGAAVGGAPDEVQAAADYVTCPVGEGPIADLLEYFERTRM